MLTRSWWQRLFKNLPGTAVRRHKAYASTRLMQVELLEDRRVPAVLPGPINIYITGNVTNGIFFTDPSRFLDGAVGPLTHLSGNTYLAKNLRSAVADVKDHTSTQASKPNKIFLESTSAGTYGLTNGVGMEIQFGTSNHFLKILNLDDLHGGNNFSTIDANTSSRIFEVDSGGMTTLDHLILQDGAPAFDLEGPIGGAILNHGNLVLTNDQLLSNSVLGGPGGVEVLPSGAYGGAIYNDSAAILKIKNTTLDGNTATGGSADFADGADAAGGALFIADGSGPVTITASTFSHNEAIGGFGGAEGNTGGQAFGGAISAAMAPGADGADTATIVNSTFADNSSHGGSAYGGGAAYGGAISVNRVQDFILVNDTIALNTANGGTAEGPSGAPGVAYGGGIFHRSGDGTISIVNTIVAENSVHQSGPGPDVFGTFNDLDHNFIGDFSGSSGFTGAHDQSGDPLFFPTDLADNGGPTQTLALRADSQAINNGTNAVTVANSTLLTTLGIGPLRFDQRGPGFARKSDHIVDIGAYEFQANLDKVYRFKSDANVSLHFSVNAAHGLLFSMPPLPALPAGYSYAIVAPPSPFDAPEPFHIGILTVNADGSFFFTAPPRLNTIIHFQFRLLVVNRDGERTNSTNLIFDATVIVTPPGSPGRGALGDFNNIGGPSSGPSTSSGEPPP